GPCSEIHFDRGPQFSEGPHCVPDHSETCPRWLEIWNLVFMEFELQPDRSLTPLPAPGVDTGMGLERLASVLQQVPTNYDTDLFTPIHARMRELLGHDPDAFEQERFSYQVIADHSRAVTFLIADDVLPGNEGRNYVLRRILRRAVRHGRLLGRREPFMAETAAVVIDVMGEAYPHLVVRRDDLLGVIAREEAQFDRTLDRGTARLVAAMERIAAEGAGGSDDSGGSDAIRPVIGRRPEDLDDTALVLPGEVAFELHDTFGFPVDLTIEMAAESNFRVDRDGFGAALVEQRERSRSGTKAGLAKHAELTSLYSAIQARAGDSTFLGYETTTAEGRIVAIVRDGMEFDELTGHGAAELVLDQTPFYAEGGGQAGDRGVVREAGSGSELFTVEDTQKPVGGLIVHRGTLHGRLRVGETVEGVVDPERRAHTMRNHTGTHLLHRALRNVVGDRARQAGSLVTPDGLRFDFPLDRGLTDAEKGAIEDEVRGVVRDDRPVSISFLPMADAIAAGADAFFDEKYGETVRTIRVEDYSFELCGGTHCRASGQIGSFVITGERSIGSGMRRIEAVTGVAADRLLRDRVAAAEDRVAALQEELGEAKRRLKAGAGAALPRPTELAAQAQEVAPGARVLTASLGYDSMDALKAAAKEIRAALGSGVIALILDADAPQLWVTVSDDLVDRGVSAGDLVKAAAGPLGAKGGGRPQMAQGMGTRREGMAEALAAVRSAVAERVAERVTAGG
nr:alanine--tRNA ligase [Chloroflexota bacterium]